MITSCNCVDILVIYCYCCLLYVDFSHFYLFDKICFSEYPLNVYFLVCVLFSLLKSTHAHAHTHIHYYGNSGTIGELNQALGVHKAHYT